MSNHKFPYKWYLADGYPANNIEKNNLNVFGTFICGGGSTMGYKLAGFNHLGGVEIDKQVADVYQTNHKPKYLFNEDIREFNKRKDLPKELYELDILDGSPPCFAAGTLVMTNEGLKPIELIQKGDLVLTHNNRFKVVTDIMNKSVTNLYNLKIQGSLSLQVTGEHPFYVRGMSRRNKSGLREFYKPKWKQVKDLSIVKNSSNTTLEQDYIGIAINNQSELPKWEGTQKTHIVYGGKDIGKVSKTLNFTSTHFWYLIGRYIGDGWLRIRKNKRNEFIICCAKDELEDLKIKFNNAGFNYIISEQKATYRIVISSKELCEYTSQFGHGAANKRLTGDILNLPIDLLSSFLDGYLESDGYYDFSRKKYSCVSISKELIYGIQACVYKVYKVPTTIIFRKAPEKSFIEGREVNCKDSYSLSFFKESKAQQHSFYENGYIWTPFRSKEVINEELTVYNISVEQDESYTVNNLICHNCSTFSMAGSRDKAWGKSKQFREGQVKQTLDDLVFIYCDTIIKLQPKVFILENVKGIIQGNAKVYSKAIVEKMTKAGYIVQVFCLNAASMGVPQKRERVFFIGYKKEFKLPKLKLEFDEKPIVFGEVYEKGEYTHFTKNEEIMNLWNKRTPKDTKLCQINGRLNNKPNSLFNNLIRKNDVCYTVTAADNNILFDEPRYLYDSEVIKIGTYPLDYSYKSIEPKYLIGMSVPPVMTAQISHQIYLQWLSKL